jgi:hypothetical protein
MYLAVLVACAIVTLGFASTPVYAVDNAALSEMVEGYNETLEKYADALLSQNWNAVKKAAKSLLEKSEEVHSMGKGNKEWLNESGLLVSHSKELIGLAGEKDGEESFFMAAGLYLHFQLLKATNPRWVIAHIENEIEEISEAIEKKDKGEAIEAAEHIHLGATCAAISGSIMKQKFANTRWIKDAHKMGMAGEEIHEAANEGNWDEAEKHLAGVKKIHKKIKGSLKR